MFITNTTVLGGRGFSIGGGGGVLKTATGYPLTLTKPLAKQPESVTVYGASGGVGDRTANLFDPFDKNSRIDDRRIIISGNLNRYTGAVTYTAIVKPSTTYTIRKASDISNLRVGFTATRETSGSLDNFTDTSEDVFTVTSASDSTVIYFYNKDLMDAKWKDVQIVEGEYTAETMPPLEPYGYRIPILINPPILPSGYTKLEYIESTGTEYIDTGIYPNDIVAINHKLKIEMGYKATSTYSTRSLMGLYGVFWGITNQNTYETGQQHLEGIIPSQTTFDIIEYEHNARAPFRTLTVNGELADARTTEPALENGSWYLLGYNGSAQPTVFGQVSYCKMYDNDTLIRNFIPAKRNSDGEIGIYDTVNDVFYTNQGTGSFIAGEEIPNKTINLYSDAALGTGESLVVNPKTKTATKHDDTSVAGLQDWDQDWKLPKADSLTVTAGTTVAPSSVEMQYYGKR